MACEFAVPTTPALVGAVLMLARNLVPQWPGWPPTVTGTLALADAGRSQAYEHLRRLVALLPEVMGSPGRPEATPVGHDLTTALQTVREYLIEHPGAVCTRGGRRVYTDGFRRFAVDLMDSAGFSVADLTQVTGVPPGTLKDWLAEAGAPTQSLETVIEGPEDLLGSIRDQHLRTIIHQWQAWKGSFQAFCRMLQTEYRLPYGTTFIGNFLQAVGLRSRRTQQPVEAPWSSDTFKAMFPGAQWLGDGTSIAVHWGDEVFVFNVEALLDPASNALVGVTVTDTENEEALRWAYLEALAAAPGPPLAITLDNRPSNHSPGAQAAVGDVTLLRSTAGRGQAKAPLEGNFGLFQQSVPPIAVGDETPREQARQVLDLIWTAWARGRNHRPRKKLKGLTPVEAYLNARPTAEDIEEAREWIRQLQRRQELSQLTREERRDPAKLLLLNHGLAELGLADPDRHFEVSLAGFGRDAIVGGLATFRSKLELGTLPAGADARYLGGIIRNLHIQHELELLSIYLLEQRVRLRDLSLVHLDAAARQVKATTAAEALPQAFVDRALEARYEIDSRYWGEAAAGALDEIPAPRRLSRYKALGRRIAVTFGASRKRRSALLDRLAATAAGP